MPCIVTVKIDARIQVDVEDKAEAIEMIEKQTYVECDCGEVVYEDIEVWSCEEVKDE